MSTARKVYLALLAIVLVVVGIPAALFTIQNSSRLTDLSLDLWVAAFQLQQPMPVPVLLWIAFGLGLVLGGGWGVVGRFSAASRARELESRLARADLSRSDDDDWT